MKFLLVALNAKYIHSNPAIYSLRAYAGEALRQYIELAEYTINQSLQEILGDIYRREPDMIGISCYIWNWRLAQELIEELPKVLPGVKLWLGGPEVSYDTEGVLKRFPQLTGIMVGEGEATFKELAEHYLRYTQGDLKPESAQAAQAKPGCTEQGLNELGRAERGLNEPGCTEQGSIEPGCMKSGCNSIGIGTQFDSGDTRIGAEHRRPGAGSSYGGADYGEKEALMKIKGLCLPGGYTPCRPPLDMNTLPFLYHELGPFENRILYYEASRGCPFRCSYCLSSVEKQVRIRDISVVKQELGFFLDNQVKQVKFVDRTFNCNHDFSMEIWQYLYENDNNVTNFHFEISADLLQEDQIMLLNCLRPGLIQLEIGIQSANPQTLQAIRRVTDLDKLERAVAAVRKGGNVHQHLDLIAGLPFEDYESFGESFNRVYRMRPEQLQLGFLKVLKGSEMWERAEEFGIVYGTCPPYEVLYTRWLTYEEVLRLKRIEEVVELYYNSAQFTHTMPFLEKAFSCPFAMYEALADFYAEKGYFTASPARARRYQVLLAFAAERDGGRETVYRELLTYDMYLRENLKSRPEFARELGPDREWIKDFYRQEERQRKYLPEYGDYDWKQLSKMTHLEPFAWPVWNREEMEEVHERWGREEIDQDVSGRSFALFDYQKRNPLNYEATVQIVEKH